MLWAPPRPPRLASEMGWAGAEALGGGEGGFCAALMCLGAVCGVPLQERRLTVSAQAVLCLGGCVRATRELVRGLEFGHWVG